MSGEAGEVAITEKLQELDTLSDILDEIRSSGKRIVVCHGVFDLLHPGHVRHLQSAREQGDVLVVSITADAYIRKGPGRPVFNEALRAEMLASLEVVGFVCISRENNAVPSIEKLRPDVYAKGPDYQDYSQDVSGQIYEEEKAVLAVGGEMYFTDDEVVFSSTKLINQHLEILSKEQKSFVEQIKDRLPSAEHAIDLIKQLQTLKVMVIGDTIIDEYVYCEPLGQSLKQQLVVHRYLKEERFCGGVIAVANQIAEFCNDVQVVTVLGRQNSFEDYVQSSLAPNVNAQIFIRDDAPTVVKRRYLYDDVDHKVFEVCYIHDGDVPKNTDEEVVRHVATEAPKYDLVVMCDYGHGAITQRIVRQARESARYLAANAQSNSANMGYNLISKKYSGLDFACIDEAEARLALQNKHGDMEALGLTLLYALDTERLIITRGANGSLTFDRSGNVCECPAFAMRVVDRVGAGDAFYAMAAVCSASGMPSDLVSFMGNAVGALAVNIVGNREPVISRDIYRLISHLFA